MAPPDEKVQCTEDLSCTGHFPPFKWTPTVAMQNMWAAQNWKHDAPGTITGTKANVVVNTTYTELDTAMLDYIGTPYIANWFTFGKWASREAGQGINDLSSAISALYDLAPTEVEKSLILAAPMAGPLAPIATAAAITKYAANHSSQISALVKIMTKDFGLHPCMAWQVMALVWGKLTNLPALKAPGDFSDPVFLAKLAYHLAKDGYEFLGKLLDSLQTMVKCLIVGNQGIYRNMAAAALTFLKAESATEGTGPAAVQTWAAGGAADSNDLNTGGSQDPQQFLFNSFTMYRQARLLTQQMSLLAADPSKDTELDAMNEKRFNLMNTANVVIGCQEQMCILQAPNVFTQPEMRTLVRSVAGTMMLHDPINGLIPLLPNGGDWTDFPSRMGVMPGTTPPTVKVANPYEGIAATDYTPQTDATKAKGSIYQYFSNSANLGNAPTKNANMSTPAWANVQTYPADTSAPLPTK